MTTTARSSRTLPFANANAPSTTRSAISDASSPGGSDESISSSGPSPNSSTVGARLGHAIGDQHQRLPVREHEVVIGQDRFVQHPEQRPLRVVELDGGRRTNQVGARVAGVAQGHGRAGREWGDARRERRAELHLVDLRRQDRICGEERDRRARDARSDRAQHLAHHTGHPRR